MTLSSVIMNIHPLGSVTHFVSVLCLNGKDHHAMKQEGRGGRMGQVQILAWVTWLSLPPGSLFSWPYQDILLELAI
jgi:hypothetical protein